VDAATTGRRNDPLFIARKLAENTKIFRNDRPHGQPTPRDDSPIGRPGIGKEALLFCKKEAKNFF